MFRTSASTSVNRWFILAWCGLVGTLLSLHAWHFAMAEDAHALNKLFDLVLTVLIGLAGPALLYALRRRDARDLRTRLEVAFDHFQAGILSTDNEGRVRYVNPALERTLGMKAERFIGLTPAEFLPEESAEIYKRERARRAQGVYEPYRIEARRGDGEPVWLQIAPAPLLDADGEVTGTLVIVHDVSEETRATQARAELEAQVRRVQRLEALGTLAGGIAHDFNNIFFAILGHAEMAEEAARETSARSDLAQITKAGERGRELVKQMLTFARTSDAERAPMDIVPLVKECAKLLASSSPIGTRVVTLLGDEVPLVETHPAAIHQVLMNLATNALQATQGSGTVSIEVTTETPDGNVRGACPRLEERPHVVLRVHDDGCGIAPKDIERLFDPFFTSREPGAGTGMGLAVVHGIVEEHGGAISVKSRLGEGSTFTVFLPARPARIDEAREASCDDVGKLRVLLVDDEVTLLRLLTSMLESLGHEVASFPSGEAALAALKRAPGSYDLVITDQAMPPMSGDAMIEAMRREGLDLPVVLATGSAPLPDRKRLEALDVRTQITKPMTLRELREGIASAIRQGAEAPVEAEGVR